VFRWPIVLNTVSRLCHMSYAWTDNSSGYSSAGRRRACTRWSV